MDDTAPEVRDLYRRMLMELTGEDRLIRGAFMYDAAREMVLASLPRGLSPEEVRSRLFERFYGESLPGDFSRRFKTAEKQMAEIMAQTGTLLP